MSVRVAINGFGRVGRCAFRSAFERGSAIEWVGINDLADIPTLAHLLRHDTVYGPFPGRVEVEDSMLLVDGVAIPVFCEADPADLPWGTHVDVVLGAPVASKAGPTRRTWRRAPRVIISA
jgi:glyceraldehyde 3-phosphate dehydrogenase